MDDADFIFQLGNLKRTPRSGWLTIGIKNCESVAEHSFRTGVLAYLLARREGLGKEKAREAMAVALLHDAHEARMGDLHRLAKRYAKPDDEMAIKETMGALGPEFGTKDKKILLIARDADLLEMFFQAKEYMDEGNLYAKEWLAPKKLKTAAAKGLYEKMVKRDSRKWILEAIEW
ncbi:MAG: HD domain-containing protein [Candidatus ainarchaeum sp.]|nr:HD domain-containing protein [Candidatus ainarchaeum sp.]